MNANFKTKPVRVTPPPRFSLRRRRNLLPAWKPPNHGFSCDGIWFHRRGDFFENQPHNSLQRGIKPGWLRSYLSSTSQLGLEGFDNAKFQFEKKVVQKRKEKDKFNML
jgi:hypothetical protein